MLFPDLYCSLFFKRSYFLTLLLTVYQVVELMKAKIFVIGCILSICGLFSPNASAQDIHFSQFYMSPLNLNPALTGIMNCNMRVSSNYRNQWSSVLKADAFKTYNVSYDQKIPVARADYFGLGVTVWGDQAGEGNFGTLQAKISGSYAKKLAGDRNSAHYLSAGVEVGIAGRTIDYLNFRYGNQANGDGVFDPDLQSFESYGRDRFLFADMSAGILWFSVFDKRNSAYVGGAYSHLNRANMSFNLNDQSTVVNIYPKYTIHAGGEIGTRGPISIIPGVVTFFQGPSWQVNGGSSIRFNLHSGPFDESSFQVGTWARVASFVDWGANQGLATPTNVTYGLDALILSMRFDWRQFGLGFSYDVNMSELKAASNGNGAFEFSLIYTICGPEKRHVFCPKF